MQFGKNSQEKNKITLYISSVKMKRGRIWLEEH